MAKGNAIWFLDTSLLQSFCGIDFVSQGFYEVKYFPCVTSVTIWAVVWASQPQLWRQSSSPRSALWLTHGTWRDQVRTCKRSAEKYAVMSSLRGTYELRCAGIQILWLPQNPLWSLLWPHSSFFSTFCHAQASTEIPSLIWSLLCFYDSCLAVNRFILHETKLTTIFLITSAGAVQMGGCGRSTWASVWSPFDPEAACHCGLTWSGGSWNAFWYSLC